MNAILILIGLMTVVIIAYIILFETQINHIKNQLEYFERSRGQLFDEIQKIWNNSINIKLLITKTNEKIEQLEFNNPFKPIPIVEQETRPIKRLESVYYLGVDPYLEQNAEYLQKTVAKKICNELKDYIVFEWECDEGRKALRGSIDIIGRI